MDNNVTDHSLENWELRSSSNKFTTDIGLGEKHSPCLVNTVVEVLQPGQSSSKVLEVATNILVAGIEVQVSDNVHLIVEGTHGDCV